MLRFVFGEKPAEAGVKSRFSLYLASVGDVDYDPYDRISTLTYLQQPHAMGEVVTGLLFVEPDPGDMHDFLDTVETPLNGLGEAELCPGPEILTRFNAAHR
jgi:2-oxoglutarate/2-oxoacid ferredoxin oxidoreductase subunit beta